jgi:hypothetical protein
LNQTNHFFDLGYGWLCKHCSAEDTDREQRPNNPTDSFARDQPAKKSSKPFGLALAGWTDATRHALTCPRCGVEESIKNS